MKPGKPMKRTELKRGKGLKPGKPLRPRSKKVEKLYKEKRVPFVKAMLAKHPICHVCLHHPEIPGGSEWATEVHEMLTRGRSGGVHGDAWLDEENCVTLCGVHHTRITDHVLFNDQGVEVSALYLRPSQDQ